MLANTITNVDRRRRQTPIMCRLWQTVHWRSSLGHSPHTTVQTGTLSEEGYLTLACTKYDRLVFESYSNVSNRTGERNDERRHSRCQGSTTTRKSDSGPHSSTLVSIRLRRLDVWTHVLNLETTFGASQNLRPNVVLWLIVWPRNAFGPPLGCRGPRLYGVTSVVLTKVEGGIWLRIEVGRKWLS